MHLLCLVCVSLLFSSSHSCYQCFFEVEESIRLCFGQILSQHRIIYACIRALDRIFNNNERVIEAGRVGKGYDKQLKELLNAEIQPLLDEFERIPNPELIYEERFETAANNFIAAASKLPRASECVPPCGFQSAGAVYNCITCVYDSCEFPLDCPVEEIQVMENSRSRMWCDLKFRLPDNIKIIWRFADEVKTQQVSQFEEVTVGVDKLYSITSTSLHHQGTYMCEIFSDQRSIVRLYFYLTVTPQDTRGYEELQDIFDLSLLPGGRFLPAADDRPQFVQPPLLLLAACLTSLLLLLFLALVTLYWLLPSEKTNFSEKDEDELGSEQLDSYM